MCRKIAVGLVFLSACCFVLLGLTSTLEFTPNAIATNSGADFNVTAEWHTKHANDTAAAVALSMTTKDRLAGLRSELSSLEEYSNGSMPAIVARLVDLLPSPLPDCDSWIIPATAASQSKLELVSALVSTNPLDLSSHWCLIIARSQSLSVNNSRVFYFDAHQFTSSPLPVDLLVRLFVLLLKPKLVFEMNVDDEFMHAGVDLKYWRLRLLHRERFAYEAKSLLENISVWATPRATLVNPLPEFNPRTTNSSTNRTQFTFALPLHFPADRAHDSSTFIRPSATATLPVARVGLVHFLANTADVVLSPQPDHLRGVALRGPLALFDGSLLYSPRTYFALLNPMRVAPVQWSVIVGRCLQATDGAYLVLAGPITTRPSETARRSGNDSSISAFIDYVSHWSGAAHSSTLALCALHLQVDLHKAGLLDSHSFLLARIWHKLLDHVMVDQVEVVSEPRPEAGEVQTNMSTEAALAMLSTRRTFSIVLRTHGHDRNLELQAIPSLQSFCDLDKFDVLFVLDYESAYDHEFAEHLYLQYGMRSVFQKLPARWQEILVRNVKLPPRHAYFHVFFTVGYTRQNWGTLYLDTHTASDVLGIMDADSPLMAALSRAYLFTNNNLGLNARAYDTYKGDCFILKLAIPGPIEAMQTNVFPYFYYRDTFVRFREHILLIHGKSFDDVWATPALFDYDNPLGQFTEEEKCKLFPFCVTQNYPVSNFNLLSNYAYTMESDLYHTRFQSGSIQHGFHKIKMDIGHWNTSLCVVFDENCDPRRSTVPAAVVALEKYVTSWLTNSSESHKVFLEWYTSVRYEFHDVRSSSKARMLRALHRGPVTKLP